MKNNIKNNLLAATIIGLLQFSGINPAFASSGGVELASDHVQRGRHYTCGYLDGSWEPGKYKRGKFYTVKAKADAALAKWIAGGRKSKSLRKKYLKLQHQRLKGIARYCGSLDPLDSDSVVTSLSQLPSTSSLVNENAAAASFGITSVSGTPPTLSSLATTPPETVFWAPGVIDAIISGSPTQDQCNQMFAGQEDGQSGGYAACQLAQGVGQSFEPILRSGTSLCYMKNFPTTEVYAAGATSVVSGTLPDNDITKLFSPPSGSTSRIVRVEPTFPGDEGSQETITIRVYSRGENALAGNQYATDLLFCVRGQAHPFGYERHQVSTDNLYTSINNEANDFGRHTSTITAYLAQNDSGGVVFDSTRARSAVLAFVSGASEAFKSELSVSADNYIFAKTYSVFQDAPRKGVSYSNFSGSSIGNLRFLQGAFKDEWFDTFRSETVTSEVATEYRDSFYASAPTSLLLSTVDAVNFATDSFYAEAPSVTLDTDNYDCNQNADIVVTLDMTNSAMQTVATTCEGDRLDNMGFCFQSETLRSAQNHFNDACIL